MSILENMVRKEYTDNKTIYTEEKLKYETFRVRVYHNIGHGRKLLDTLQEEFKELPAETQKGEGGTDVNEFANRMFTEYGADQDTSFAIYSILTTNS